MQDMTWQLEPYSGAWISRHSSRTASIRETRSRGCATAWPGFQTWWATRKHWHTDEFCALIDRHIQTAKPKIYDGYN